MKYNQNLIREKKMDKKEDFEEIIEKMAQKRQELDEEVSEKQHERLGEIRFQLSQTSNFQKFQDYVDREIEYLILYYTSDMRKIGEIDLDSIYSRVKINEKIIRKRTEPVEVKKTRSIDRKPTAGALKFKSKASSRSKRGGIKSQVSMK